MRNPFDKAFVFLATWEWGNRADGSPHNDPMDPGGYTKYGVSQRGHPEVDVPNLTLPDAMQLYWNEYWLPIGGSSLPWDLAICAFDSAVNTGIRRTRKWLETCKTTQELNEKRVSYYLSLQNPRYEKGWLNRVNDLKKYIDILRQQEEPQ